MGIVVLGGIYVFSVPVLEWIGFRLLATSPLLEPPWDAIIVLSGRPFERSLKAAELYSRYPAPVIALGGAHNDDLLAIQYQPSQECAFTRLALRELCIPDSAIWSVCEGTSTYEEILVLRRVCLSQGWRRIVIVSSPFHGRRIERLARKWLGSASIQYAVVACRPLQYLPETWWRYEAGILTVWEEYAKVWYYLYRGYI